MHALLLKGGLFCCADNECIWLIHITSKKGRHKMWRPIDCYILLVPAVAMLGRTNPYQVRPTVILLLLVAAILKRIGVLDDDCLEVRITIHLLG